MFALNGWLDGAPRMNDAQYSLAVAKGPAAGTTAAFATRRGPGHEIGCTRSGFGVVGGGSGVAVGGAAVGSGRAVGIAAGAGVGAGVVGGGGRDVCA